MPDDDDENPLADAQTALGWKKATGDSGSAEKFSVDELIAFDKYKKGIASGGRVIFKKIVPGGAS
jgi:hypothetical protein